MRAMVLRAGVLVAAVAVLAGCSGSSAGPHHPSPSSGVSSSVHSRSQAEVIADADATVKSSVRAVVMDTEKFSAAHGYSATPFQAGQVTAKGQKPSRGVTVQISGNAADGYCLRASATGSSASGGRFFWYDSVPGEVSAAASATAPAGGACAAATSWVTA